MRRDVADEQLRTLLEQGISQREIARRLGIPRSKHDHDLLYASGEFRRLI